MRFVFVHGGFHAEWCWERTIAELRQLGHDGVAVDLPGTAPSLTIRHGDAQAGPRATQHRRVARSPFLGRPRELAELLVHATTPRRRAR
jgi:pimeloyl-ACP methyl ester carboxylesterase